MHRDLKLLSLSLFIWGLGEGLFLFFQPIYLQQLGANPIQIGSIMGLVGIALGAAQIPAGHLSDKIGAKLLIRSSWVIGAFATIIMALASNLTIFVVGMVLYALTGAVVAPMNSYIASVKGRMSMARALTFSVGSFSLGSMVGPLTGGIISQRIGLRSVYWVAFILFIISTIAAFFLNEKEDHPEEIVDAHFKPWHNKYFNLYLLLVFLMVFAVYLPFPLTANYLHNSHAISFSLLGILGALTSLGYVILALLTGHIKPEINILLSQILMIFFCWLIYQGNGIFIFSLAYLFASSFRYLRSMVIAFSRQLIRKKNTGLAFGVIETVSAIGYTIAPVAAGFIAAYNPRNLYPISFIILILTLLSSIFALKYIKRENLLRK
jgi:MFS family permease